MGAMDIAGVAGPAEDPGDVQEALRDVGGPFLAALDPAHLAHLARGARLRTVAAGRAIFPNYDDGTGIVVSGITRTFLRSHDGRQLSIRYARRGSTIGTITGQRRTAFRLTVQAVTDCQIVELDRTALGELVASDGGVGAAALDEMARRLHDLYSAAAINAFGSIRARIARQLVDVAQRDPTTGVLVATVTQQEVADALGTVREVVARNLASMRREGVIGTEKGRITLRDPDRLAASIAGWSDD